MATSEENTFRILLVIGAIALLGIVGLGVLYLISPREEVEQEPVLSREEAYEENVLAGDQVDTLAHRPESLIIQYYTLEREEDAIEGSIVNEADRAYVNIQVQFDLYNTDGEHVGIGSDTTGLLEPGDIWQFYASVPDEAVIAEVSAGQIQATSTTMD